MTTQPINKPYKITAIQDALKRLGIETSLDNIRKLELAGIVLTTHNPVSKHREFTEEQFKGTMRNLLLYFFNTPITEILSGNETLLKARVKTILKAARNLSK